MYYIFLSSALFTVRMYRVYLTAILLSMTFFFSSPAISGEVAAEGGQCVILLHGLARTSHSMDKMERALPHRQYRLSFTHDEDSGPGIDGCQ